MFATRDIAKTVESKGGAYKHGHVLPVLLARELMASARYSALVTQIEPVTKLNKTDFGECYRQLLSDYAEFVQVIPYQPDGALCGLLNYGVARAVLAFQAIGEDGGPEPTPLLRYAAFTAGLLGAISKVVINQNVTLVDGSENFVADWSPFLGSMNEWAPFYKLYPVAPVYNRLEHSITPLLARQIMPKRGFQWIANDPAIFADWLDALLGDKLQGGRLSMALANIPFEDIEKLMRALHEVPIKAKASTKNQHGEAFLDWLQDQLEKGALETTTEDASVQIVEEGVLVDAKVFDTFKEGYTGQADAATIAREAAAVMGIETGDEVFSVYREKRATDPKSAGIASASFAANLVKSQVGLKHGLTLGDPARHFINATMPVKSHLQAALQSKPPGSQQPPAALEGMAQAQSQMSFSARRK